MTRDELIREVTRLARGREDRSLCLADVEAVLNVLGDVATRELATGGEVPLPGLGRLKVKERAARTGRNPRTGEALAIPASRVAVFVAGKKLDSAVRG